MKHKKVIWSITMLIGALLIGFTSVSLPSTLKGTISMENLLNEATAGCEVETSEGTVVCKFAFFKSCQIEFETGEVLTCRNSKFDN